MMAWTTQFYHEFYDQSGNLCRFELKEDNIAFNQLVDASKNPFQIIRPDKDIMDPVKGSGCTMTLLSPTDRYFIGLFTADMDQYRIELRVDSVLTWFGYLTSEIYSEPYDEETGYFVRLYGNNGFALLDRIKFLDGSGDPYTGLKTQWEVLQIVLGYWGLMSLVVLLKIALNTTSTEVTIAGGETLFHQTYVSCANYYDEDGEAWTCRQVLEDLLATYGAFIQMQGASILIQDIDSMAGDITWNTYTNVFVYNGQTQSLAAAVDDLEDDVGYFQKGSHLDVIGGINRQVVRFSKYTPDNLTDKIQDTNEMGFASPTTEVRWVQLTSCDADSWIVDNIESLTDWSFSLAVPLRVSGCKEDTDGQPEYYIRMNQPNTSEPYDENYYDDDHSEITFPTPYVIGRGGFYIKIEGKIFPLTREDPYKEAGGACTDDAEFDHVVLMARLVVGGLLYQVNTKTWITYPGTIQPEHQFRIYGGAADENCKNKWHNFKVEPWTHSETKKHPVADDAVYIYLEPDVHGQISIEFTRQIYAYVGGSKDDSESVKIEEVFIKDLKVSVVSNPDFIDLAGTDIEYVGELNPDWKNEGPEITLHHGCSGVDGTPFDNGGLIYKDGSNDYHHFTEWTRGGQTDVIEKLLLNTVESNRENSAASLSVNINNTTGVQSLRYVDAAYMSGKMFMVRGSTLDVADGSEKIKLQEVIADTHTID